MEKKPRGTKGRPQNAESRRKKSLANKRFYEETPHHSVGQPKAPSLNPVALGTCSVCDRTIYEERFLTIGMDADCLREAVETGRVVVIKGEYVLLKRRKKK